MSACMVPCFLLKLAFDQPDQVLLRANEKMRLSWTMPAKYYSLQGAEELEAIGCESHQANLQEGVLGLAAQNKRTRDPDKGSSRRPQRPHDQTRPFSLKKDGSKIERPNTTPKFLSLILLIAFYLATYRIKSRRVLCKISPHAARNFAPCLMKSRRIFMKSSRAKQPVNSQRTASLFRQADPSPPDRRKLHSRAQQKNAHRAWKTDARPPVTWGKTSQNSKFSPLLLTVMRNGWEKQRYPRPLAT